jgi:hypothetical protein
MSENPILMTQAEYARHRNKSPQYIGKLYKAGILVMSGRLMDVAASDAVREARDGRPGARELCPGEAGRHSVPRQTAPPGVRYPPGKLVEAAVVKERWAAILVVIKERVLAVPDKLAPELTAVTNERQVRDSLKREMHVILKAIHEDPVFALKRSRCGWAMSFCRLRTSLCRSGQTRTASSAPNRPPNAASGALTWRQISGRSWMR